MQIQNLTFYEHTYEQPITVFFVSKSVVGFEQ